ncbi:hypothetical protein G7Y79_00006g018870 [Physcia stellaris]|nr:hypothetical protein G7Y79_00006g018870 [Physcia stellaris]
MMASSTPESTPIAIIGAGISGLILALALHERHISFQIFEQSTNFNQFGAGLNLNPSGIRAVQASSAAAFKTFEKVRTPHHPTNEDFYFAYTDGERTFDLNTEEGKGGVKRSRWIEELAKELPANAVQFGKRLRELHMPQKGPIELLFEDGTNAYAEAVIGCDGIKSKIRRSIVGAHPSADPSFAHVVAYRSLMSKDDARRLLGPALAECAHVCTSKGIFYVSYPITGGTHNNFGIFTEHESDWPHYPNMSISSSKQELLGRLEDRRFIELASSLTDDLDVWAIYDMASSPLPTYSKGRLAVAGDAAHASTPNLGAGAGFSIEDVTVLAELLAEVYSTQSSSNDSVLCSRLTTALEVYSDARISRTQWLVERSRRLGMANLGQPIWDGMWDWGKFRRDTVDSYHTVWNGHINDMVAQAKEEFSRRLAKDDHCIGL